MFTILLGEDDCGAIPLQLRDGEAFLRRGGYRWRVVATTDDPEEAAGVMELLNGYCFNDEPSSCRGEPSAGRTTAPGRGLA